MSEQASTSHGKDTAEHIQALYFMDSATESVAGLTDEHVLSLFRAANLATAHALLSDSADDARFIGEYMDRADRLGAELHRRQEKRQHQQRK